MHGIKKMDTMLKDYMDAKTLDEWKEQTEKER